ncbi:hypothetical protein [Celeribacter sp. ULVN23_4]
MSDENEYIQTLTKILNSQIAERRVVASEWRESSDTIATIEDLAAHQRRIEALKAAISDEQAIAKGEKPTSFGFF